MAAKLLPQSALMNAGSKVDANLINDSRSLDMQNGPPAPPSGMYDLFSAPPQNSAPRNLGTEAPVPQKSAPAPIMSTSTPRPVSAPSTTARDSRHRMLVIAWAHEADLFCPPLYTFEDHGIMSKPESLRYEHVCHRNAGDGNLIE
ncbi:hypothetical protein DOTSEDRAFT_29973 [Dothistroma septosporum NZE10]|uniref:Uncharacterized protein n=1 Tax=Dothistroma septosporum (strain NZE10 / CBS 128990) TaxID=675120 RepID=N1PYN3_DOTSN|nr:hypothetical protein DOTSEDRAFT_29973 [Dothistroma septosporum NZE10]